MTSKKEVGADNKSYENTYKKLISYHLQSLKVIKQERNIF